MSKIEDLKQQAAALAGREILVETNDGTYSTAEAARVTGSGDPAHNTYRIYQRVGDDARRRTGRDGETPGRARHFGGELKQAKADLARLHEEIARLERQ